jgi:hypothetical protein
LNFTQNGSPLSRYCGVGHRVGKHSEESQAHSLEHRRNSRVCPHAFLPNIVSSPLTLTCLQSAHRDHHTCVRRSHPTREPELANKAKRREGQNSKAGPKTRTPQDFIPPESRKGVWTLPPVPRRCRRWSNCAHCAEHKNSVLWNEWQMGISASVCGQSSRATHAGVDCYCHDCISPVLAYSKTGSPVRCNVLGLSSRADELLVVPRIPGDVNNIGFFWNREDYIPSVCSAQYTPCRWCRAIKCYCNAAQVCKHDGSNLSHFSKSY